MPEKVDFGEYKNVGGGQGDYVTIKENEDFVFRIMDSPINYKSGEEDFFGNENRYDTTKMKVENEDGEIKSLTVQKYFGHELYKTLNDLGKSFEDSEDLLLKVLRNGEYDWEVEVVENESKELVGAVDEEEEEVEEKEETEEDSEKELEKAIINEVDGTTTKSNLTAKVYLNKDIDDADSIREGINELVTQGILLEEGEDKVKRAI